MKIVLMKHLHVCSLASKLSIIPFPVTVTHLVNNCKEMANDHVIY